MHSGGVICIKSIVFNKILHYIYRSEITHTSYNFDRIDRLTELIKIKLFVVITKAECNHFMHLARVINFSVKWTKVVVERMKNSKCIYVTVRKWIGSDASQDSYQFYWSTHEVYFIVKVQTMFWCLLCLISLKKGEITFFLSLASFECEPAIRETSYMTFCATYEYALQSLENSDK